MCNKYKAALNLTTSHLTCRATTQILKIQGIGHTLHSKLVIVDFNRVSPTINLNCLTNSSLRIFLLYQCQRRNHKRRKSLEQQNEIQNFRRKMRGKDSANIQTSNNSKLLVTSFIFLAVTSLEIASINKENGNQGDFGVLAAFSRANLPIDI